jgi:hypothetical protein
MCVSMKCDWGADPKAKYIVFMSEEDNSSGCLYGYD